MEIKTRKQAAKLVRAAVRELLKHPRKFNGNCYSPSARRHCFIAEACRMGSGPDDRDGFEMRTTLKLLLGEKRYELIYYYIPIDASLSLKEKAAALLRELRGL